MKDTWCRPVLSRHGNVVSGGAARLVRTAAAGGMDAIIARSVRRALEEADEDVRRARPKLRVVR